MAFDIVFRDGSVDFNVVSPEQECPYPLSNYRVKWFIDRILVYLAQEQTNALSIKDIGEINSITDSTTGGIGVIAVPGTLKEAYDIIRPFFFDVGAGAIINPFFNDLGDIVGTLDGVGFVRAASLYINSIGFNSTTPDKDNVVSFLEGRYNSSINTSIATDVNSTAQIDFLTFANSVGITTDAGGFLGGYMYIEDEAFDMSHNGGGANGVVVSSYGESTGSAWTSTLKNIYNSAVNTAGNVVIAPSSNHFNAYPILFGGINATSNQNIVNAVGLGGDGLILNKDRYAFAENLEVQGGIGGCTVPPETLGGWAALSYSTRAYTEATRLVTKSGVVTGASFVGAPDRISAVAFSTNFADANYSVSVIGGEGRAWTIQSQTAAGFTINSNAAIALVNNVYWTAIKHGESI